MSFQLFMKDLQAEDLTQERLEKVWKNSNLTNKSPLIDPLMRSLFNQLKKKSADTNTPLEQVSIVATDVAKMCEKYVNIMIRQKIQSTEPLLETIPSNALGIQSGWKYNPPSSIIFRPCRYGDKDIYVATKVLSGTRTYPLQTKHINICISNGWYFETDKDYISCPFRISVPS